jgi:Trypsin-co-occurring domain 2
VAELDVPLAEAVHALRAELVSAIEEGEGEALRFGVGPVELELQVEVSREVGGKAGIQFWLVSIGGEGSRSSGSVHTVRLTLSPVDERGEPVTVHSSVRGRPE